MTQNTSSIITDTDKIIDSAYDVLNHVKPTNLIRLLVRFYTARTKTQIMSTGVQLLELYGIYWSNNTKFFTKLKEILIYAMRGIPLICKQANKFLKKVFKKLKLKFCRKTLDFLAKAKIEEDSSGEEFYDAESEPQEREMSNESLDGVGDLLSSMLSGFSKPLAILGALILTIGSVITGGALASFTETGKSIAKFLKSTGEACRSSKFIFEGIRDLYSLIVRGISEVFDIELDEKGKFKKELIVKINEKIVEMNEFHTMCKTDMAKVMSQPHLFRKIEDDMKKMQELYTEIASADENLSNLKPLYDNLREAYISLKEYYTNLTNAITGKQIPATLWLYGDSGVGKSYLVRDLIERLSALENRSLTAFTRNCQDGYWSGYCGQDVVIYDDFNSNKECVDHAELVSIYTDNPFGLNMAALQDKGMQFSSRYLIICSNFSHVSQSQSTKGLNDPRILNRRRDIVVRVHDKELAKIRSETFDMPDSSHYKSDWSHCDFVRIGLDLDGNGNTVATTIMNPQTIADFLYTKQIERMNIFRDTVARKLSMFRDGTTPTAPPACATLVNNTVVVTVPATLPPVNFPMPRMPKDFVPPTETERQTSINAAFSEALKRKELAAAQMQAADQSDHALQRQIRAQIDALGSNPFALPPPQVAPRVIPPGNTQEIIDAIRQAGFDVPIDINPDQNFRPQAPPVDWQLGAVGGESKLDTNLKEQFVVEMNRLGVNNPKKKIELTPPKSGDFSGQYSGLSFRKKKKPRKEDQEAPMKDEAHNEKCIIRKVNARVSAFLLYGEAGTGKTTILELLSECFDVPVIRKPGFTRQSVMLFDELGSSQAYCDEVVKFLFDEYAQPSVDLIVITGNEMTYEPMIGDRQKIAAFRRRFDGQTFHFQFRKKFPYLVRYTYSEMRRLGFNNCCWIEYELKKGFTFPPDEVFGHIKDRAIVKPEDVTYIHNKLLEVPLVEYSHRVHFEMRADDFIAICDVKGLAAQQAAFFGLLTGGKLRILKGGTKEVFDIAVRVFSKMATSKPTKREDIDRVFLFLNNANSIAGINAVISFGFTDCQFIARLFEKEATIVCRVGTGFFVQKEGQIIYRDKNLDVVEDGISAPFSLKVCAKTFDFEATSAHIQASLGEAQEKANSILENVLEMLPLFKPLTTFVKGLVFLTKVGLAVWLTVEDTKAEIKNCLFDELEEETMKQHKRLSSVYLNDGPRDYHAPVYVFEKGKIRLENDDNSDGKSNLSRFSSRSRLSIDSGDESDFSHGGSAEAYNKWAQRKMPRGMLNEGENSDCKSFLSKYRAQPRLTNIPERKMEPETMRDQGARDLSGCIARNTVYMLKSKTSEEFQCRGIMLGEKIGVTNAHAYRNFDVGDTIHFDYDGVFEATILKINRRKDQLFFEAEKKCKTFQDLTCHLLTHADVKDLSDNPALLVTVSRKSGVIDTFCRIVYLESIVTRKVDHVEREGLLYSGHCSGYAYDPICTVYGDCGSPIIVMNNSKPRKFIGYHTCSNETKGISTMIFKEDLPEKIMKSEFIEGNEIKILPHQDVKQVFEDDYKLFKVFGQAWNNEEDKPRELFHPTQSHLYRSPFILEDPKHEPAVMSIHDPRISPGARPYEDAMDKWSHPQPEIDEEILRLVVDCVANDIANTVKAKKIPIRVLTKTESINRCTEIDTSNPIWRKSSAGYPYSHWKGVKQKESFFEIHEKSNGEIYYTFSKGEHGQKLLHNVDSLINAARKGQRTAVVFSGALKDEPLKLKKIYDCTTTRSFAGSPLDYTIANRMYFHAATAGIAACRDTLPPAIGTDARSTEWHMLYQRLAKNSTIGFDADFKGWDATVPRRFMEVLVDIYDKIYEVNDPKYCEEDAIIRKSLHSVLHGPLVTYHDFVLQCPGGQVSGQPNTAMDNSVINMLYYYYAWVVLARQHAPRMVSYECYQQNVALAVYGDDNLCTVTVKVRDWFNFEGVRQVLSKLNLTMTPADKSLDTMTWKNLEDLGFLKRSFKKIDNFVIGPIDLDSLNKMISWTRLNKTHHFWKEPDRVEFDYETISCIVNSVLEESALYGRDFFNDMTQHLQERCSMIGMRIVRWPLWESKFEQVVCGGPSSKEFTSVELERERDSAVKNFIRSELSQKRNFISKARFVDENIPTHFKMSAPAPAVPGGNDQPTVSDSAGVDALLQSGVAAPAAPTVQEMVPHTGMGNQIDPMLYTQFIDKAIVTWNTSQLAGTLLWSNPIHPDYSNDPIQVVTSIYNAWAGGLQFKFKVAGTGFHAGAIVVARLPPNINPNTISSMEQLTHFEYEMIDPKTLECQTRNIMDQRNIMFHYRPYDANNPQSFGGWFAMYVMLPLSTSSTGIGQINIRIFCRAAPDFAISQLRPRGLAGSGIGIPELFGAVTATLNAGATCPYNSMEASDFIIQPSSVVAVTDGRDGTVNFAKQSNVEICPYMRSLPSFAEMNGTLTMSATGADANLTLVPLSPGDLKLVNSRDLEQYGLNVVTNNTTSNCVFTLQSTVIIGYSMTPAIGPPLNNNWATTQTYLLPAAAAGVSLFGGRAALELKSFKTIQDTELPWAPPLGESLCYFRLAPLTPALFWRQTRQMAFAIMNDLIKTSGDERTAFLIQIEDIASGLPVSFLKLHSSGFLTAPNAVNQIIFNLSLYRFRCVGTILNTDPIPVSQEMTVNYMLTAVRNCGIESLAPPVRSVAQRARKRQVSRIRIVKLTRNVHQDVSTNRCRDDRDESDFVESGDSDCPQGRCATCIREDDDSRFCDQGMDDA